MEIKYSTGKPPNDIYGRCRKQFGPMVDWSKGVVITYGDTVHCCMPLPEHLKVHESTHVRQQLAFGPELWWERYFADPAFRWKEESEAYRAQWEFIKKNSPRSDRRMLRDHLENSMLGMYGDMCTVSQINEILK